MANRKWDAERVSKLGTPYGKVARRLSVEWVGVISLGKLVHAAVVH